MADTLNESNSADKESPSNLLRRVFVPIEKRMTNGAYMFQTTDKTVYVRAELGAPMRRAIPKLRGKAARRADKRARRK